MLINAPISGCVFSFEKMNTLTMSLAPTDKHIITLPVLSILYMLISKLCAILGIT